MSALMRATSLPRRSQVRRLGLLAAIFLQLAISSNIVYAWGWWQESKSSYQGSNFFVSYPSSWSTEVHREGYVETLILEPKGTEALVYIQDFPSYSSESLLNYSIDQIVAFKRQMVVPRIKNIESDGTLPDVYGFDRILVKFDLFMGRTKTPYQMDFYKKIIGRRAIFVVVNSSSDDLRKISKSLDGLLRSIK